MNAPAARISVEDFLTNYQSIKPAREYVDGVLYPKSMPTVPHGLIQSRLGRLVFTQGFEALLEITVRMAPAKFLVPDLIVVPLDEVGKLPLYPVEPVYLCVEILSPSDGMNTVLSKCGEYHAWGVPYTWIIDPSNGAGWEYHASFQPVQQQTELHAGSLAVPLGSLFV